MSHCHPRLRDTTWDARYLSIESRGFTRDSLSWGPFYSHSLVNFKYFNAAEGLVNANSKQETIWRDSLNKRRRRTYGHGTEWIDESRSLFRHFGKPTRHYGESSHHPPQPKQDHARHGTAIYILPGASGHSSDTEHSACYSGGHSSSFGSWQRRKLARRSATTSSRHTSSSRAATFRFTFPARGEHNSHQHTDTASSSIEFQHTVDGGEPKTASFERSVFAWVRQRERCCTAGRSSYPVHFTRGAHSD